MFVFFLVWHFLVPLSFLCNTNHVLWAQCVFMEHLAPRYSWYPGRHCPKPRPVPCWPRVWVCPACLGCVMLGAVWDSPMYRVVSSSSSVGVVSSALHSLWTSGLCPWRGLLRVVLLWSFSVGLWWTCIRHLCCCGHGVTGQAVSTPRFSAGPCLLSPSWGVCITVPSSVLTLASWCSGCFSPACGLCEPSF